MEILTSIQKERLLWHVQQQGHLISVDYVAKLIMTYENLMVEDFAPPILPFELYEQLRYRYTDPQEINAWERLLQRPQESEEDLNELIREIKSYQFFFSSSRLSHVYEADIMLNNLRRKLELLKQVKEWKNQGEHPRIEETQRPKPVSYIQRTITPTDPECSREELFSGGKKSWFKRLFSKKVTYDNVFCSAFASAEVRLKSHLQIQVYFHLFEETEKVKALAQEADKDAERRDYIPLQCKLKKGDKVDVLLSIYGATLLMSDKKSVVWQGSFTKCSFDYFVPKDLDVDELSCMALLTVNDIPMGEMRFITKIVESPRQLHPKIIAHRYNKVFISYAHKDKANVKSFHEGLKLAGIEHFFDRAYLKAGDIFPQVIQDYIDSADLFVLFWSENASKSDYVDKERKQALKRAFPQVKPQQAAKLSIYPISIEPRAELPSDMKDNYHFGEL